MQSIPTPQLINGRQALFIAILVPALLYTDTHSDILGQGLIGLIAWSALLWLMRTLAPQQRALLWACLLYATAGELFLSLYWGLYSYRLDNVPLYVPPGHVLLFLLGQYLSRHMPADMPWAILAAFGGLVTAAASLGLDQLSVLLLLFFAASLFTRADRRLMGTMFLLALSLELTGTALGNWQWAAQVPLWEISTHNPPLASGAFYCLLDILVLISLPTATTAKTQAQDRYNRAPLQDSPIANTDTL